MEIKGTILFGVATLLVKSSRTQEGELVNDYSHRTATETSYWDDRI